MGGAWERMIRSVRKIFTGLTRDQTLNDKLFSTFMTEVKGILNSRPLVPIMFDDSTQNCYEELLICYLVCFQKKIVTLIGIGPKYNSLAITFGADG